MEPEIAIKVIITLSIVITSVGILLVIVFGVLQLAHYYKYHIPKRKLVALGLKNNGQSVFCHECKYLGFGTKCKYSGNIKQNFNRIEINYADCEIKNQNNNCEDFKQVNLLGIFMRQFR